MNGFVVGESHLSLGRMDIDIDTIWIDLQEQHKSWMTPLGDERSVAFSYGVRHRQASNRATIDKQLLGCA
jgi:hypothetical protein